jgi:hypothetical protein
LGPGHVSPLGQQALCPIAIQQRHLEEVTTTTFQTVMAEKQPAAAMEFVSAKASCSKTSHEWLLLSTMALAKVL